MADTVVVAQDADVVMEDLLMDIQIMDTLHMDMDHHLQLF